MKTNYKVNYKTLLERDTGFNTVDPGELSHANEYDDGVAASKSKVF